MGESTVKQGWCIKTWRIIVYMYDRFFDDGCANRAAALAYTTLLSIVPIMMVGFTILSLFPLFKGVGQTLQQFVLANFVADSANVISQHLNQFLQQLRVLSWSNIAFLVFASVLMIYNMVTAFNDIWHVKMERHFAISFLIYLVVLLITPVLFGLIMVISTYLTTLPTITGVDFVKKPIVMLMPYIAAFITFTFFNWILPSAKVRLMHAATAGLITTVFFELAKYFFSMYVSYAPTYRLIYGALATIPIFLVWIYVSWTIILIGALICHVMATGLPDSVKK